MDETLQLLLGFEPGAFAGTFESWAERIHPDDREAVLGSVERAVERGGTYQVEHRVVAPDGSVRWIEARGEVVATPEGDVVGTTGCAWDVTDELAVAREREQAVAQLEEAARRDRVAHARLAFLTDLVEALAGARDEADALHRAAKAAVPRLGDWCSIAVVTDDKTPHFEVAHTDPEMIRYARDLIDRFPYDPAARTGIANVIRTGATEFVAEIDAHVLAALDTTDEGREIVRDLALHSWIIVPLRSHDRVLGAMQFVNSSSSRTYTEDDVVLAEAVADRIASAIENRRLVDELHRDRFRTALDSLLDHVTIARSVRDDEGRIVDFTIEFMNAPSRDGAGRGPDELVGKRVTEMYPNIVDSGLYEHYLDVVQRRVSFVQERVPYEDVTPDGRPIRGWWTVHVVPFGDGYLASSRDETDAVRAEQEIQHAREAELRTSHAMMVLQRSALPTSLPTVAGLRFGVRYEPAGREFPVGGDWYDAFRITGRDSVGIVIADVAGHGRESAGVMLQVRNTLRAFALEGRPPDEVLRRTNDVIRATADAVRFVTCSYAVIQPDASVISFANAGHLPPLVHGVDGTVYASGRTGAPLGVLHEPEYGVDVLHVCKGDLLLWFTDGLVERRDEHLDVSLDRLRGEVALLPRHDPQHVVDRIVDDAIDGTVRSYDIAVVAVAISDPD
jgi:PAS domain-containing protein